MGHVKHLSMMVLWSLLPMCISMYLLNLNGLKIDLSSVDAYVSLCCALLIVMAYMFSPCNRIAAAQQRTVSFEYSPQTDMASAYALAKGVSAGTVILGTAAIADATGFGVFMASASALGAAGASFTAIHTSMSVLGFLLNPVVYILISLVTFFAVTFTFLKTGTQQIRRSIIHLNKGEFNEASDLIGKASNRSMSKPTVEIVNQLQETINNNIESRRKIILNFDHTESQLKDSPNRLFLNGYIIGLLLSTVAIWIMFYNHVIGCFSSCFVILAICTFCSERYVSNAMHGIVFKKPIIQAEIDFLVKLDGITIFAK